MSTVPQTIRRPRKWPRYIGAILAVLLILYFVVSSGPFLRAFVLPQVESAIACKLEVDKLSLSPFRQLELQRVKVTPIGAEPLAQVERIKLRYNLWALLGGKIQAHEITVEKPVVTLVELADGTLNLPKIPRSKSKRTTIELDLHQIQLRDGQLSYSVRGARGVTLSTTVRDLHVTLDQLVTGQPGKLAIGGQADLNQTPTDRLAGKMGGEWTVTLGPDAYPKLIKGSLSLELTEAAGAFRDASGLGLALESDITEVDVRDLRLAFRRGGQELGRLKLSGPYDTKKPEARLEYELSGIDRPVLVLVGGALGYDLGDSSATAKGKLNLLNSGILFASDGELSLSQMSLGTPTGRTPKTDVRVRYKAEVNLADKAALVETLQMTATDGRGEWLTGTLDQPMNLALNKELPGFRAAKFSLKLARFELGEWRSLLGTNAPTGNVRADLEVTSEKNGRLVNFTLAGVASQLNATFGVNSLQNGLFEFSGAGKAGDFDTIELSRLGFTLKQGANELASGTLLGDWQMKSMTGGAQMNVEGEIPPLLGLIPINGVRAQQGRFKLSTQANQRDTRSTYNLILTVNQFTGQAHGAELANYDADAKFTASTIGEVIDIQRCTLAIGSGATAGGNFDVTGRWDLAKQSGNFDFQIAKLNESALSPWLAPLLKPNRLQSITVDASGKAQIDPTADTAITTELKLVNFRSLAPAGQVNGPLNLGFSLNAVGRQSVLDLRQATLQLGATDRAKNELAITGRVDLAPSNAAPSTLSIRSEALDLTPWYQLFSGNPAATTEQVQSPVVRPNVEPDPVRLPLAKLTTTFDIAKLYLGTILGEKWKGRIDLDHSVISVKPFDLTLNGTPVTASAVVNLGVPGWQYDLNLTAPNLEVSPFVNTFRPEYQGKVGGRLSTDLAFKGAGVTGLGFQKNLSGSFNLHSTNLNIDLAGLQDAKKRQAAKLISKPKAGVLSLIGEAFGGAGSAMTPGWYEEISRSPIDTVILRGEAANGRLRLKEGLVQSPVLRATPSGGMAFAPELNDSVLELPVALALRGGVARQLRLSQETNQYIALPPLLTVVGTLGKPSPKVDKLTVAQLLAKSSTFGGLVDQVTGGKPGAVTERVGGVLNALKGGGTQPETGATPATNAAPRKPNPLNLLNEIIRPKTPAPAPGAPTPAQPPGTPAPKK